MTDATIPEPTTEAPARIIVDLVGDWANGLLAESRFVERPFLPGGEHNMYELAFAAVAAGYEVELRGWLHGGTFAQLKDALDIAPAVDLSARRPEATDLVVVPEGWSNPLEYARLYLSAARLAVFVLAPPGLFGWPFCGPGWSPPDPLTVALDEIGAPAQFAAMGELGISLVTHSPGIVAAAHAAGVTCAFVGTGRPGATLSEPQPQRGIDVAGLLANRWAPLVQQVAAELGDVEVDLIGESSNEEILSRLSNARILLWPSRIEGHATIPWEARTVGCVPVALSTNRFGVGLTEADGALTVDTIGELAPTIRGLLADSQRWQELSERAIRSAPMEVEWEAYVRRVQTWLDSLPARTPQNDARAGMGAALSEWLEGRAAEALRDRELAAEEQRVRAERDRIEATLSKLYRTPEVRLALRLYGLRSRHARLQRLR